MGKAKRRRTKREGREKMREEKEKANKRKQSNRCEKGNRRVGNLEQERRGNEIYKGSKEVSTRMIPQID